MSYKEEKNRFLKIIHIKKVYLIFLFLISLLITSCSIQGHNYIGYWVNQPKTDKWANLKHRICITFPNQNWQVYTCPDSAFMKISNLNWPKPDHLAQAFTILVASESRLGIEEMNMRFGKSLIPKSKNDFLISQLENNYQKFALTLGGYYNSFYMLSTIKVPEHIGLYEIVALIKKGLNKLNTMIFFRKRLQMEDYEIKQLDQEESHVQGKKVALVRYQVKNPKNMFVPVLNLLLAIFKVDDRIILMSYAFLETEYRHKREILQSIIDSFQLISTKQEYKEIVETPCDINEMKVNMIRVYDYKKALKIKRLLNKGKDFSQLAKKYSELQSSNTNGYIGCVNRDDLQHEFKPLLDTLSIGHPSEITEIRSHYYIVMLSQ